MSWLDDTPDQSLEPPEASFTEPDEDQLYDEARQRAVDERPRGSLQFRLSDMIRHVSQHDSFDKRKLVQLLKDSQKFVSGTKATGALPDSPLFRHQAD